MGEGSFSVACWARTAVEAIPIVFTIFSTFWFDPTLSFSERSSVPDYGSMLHSMAKNSKHI